MCALDGFWRSKAVNTATSNLDRIHNYTFVLDHSGNSQNPYLVPSHVKMPQLLSLISLVSLASLASIATCYPVLDHSETFSLIGGQQLPPFNPDQGVIEIPQDLAESDFYWSKLEIPAPFVTDSSPISSLFDPNGLEVASGPLCRVPSLMPSCCPAATFTFGACTWGNSCADDNVQLCCAQNSDATAGDCEPPKIPTGTEKLSDSITNGELLPSSPSLGIEFDDPSFEFNPR